MRGTENIYLVTNSLIGTKSLSFLNEIFQKHVGLNNKAFINPKRNFSFRFHIGDIIEQKRERPDIFKHIANIAAQTETFSVGLRQAEIITGSRFNLALVIETGTTNLSTLRKRLLDEKLIGGDNRSRFMSDTTIAWVGEQRLAETIVSEINQQQFFVEWRINEIAVEEFDTIGKKYFTSNIFPLKPR